MGFLFGGQKGGGGSGSADNTAERMERERQARIRASTQAINQRFADPAREQAYGQHRANVYDYNLQKLNEEQQRANRKLRFALARSGQSGGSGDVYARQQFQKNLDDARLRIAQHADAAANRFRTADEQAKLRLLSQAQSGMSATNAARNAASQLALNAEQAGSYNDLAAIGDLFSGIALINNRRPGQVAGTGTGRQGRGEDQYQTLFNQSGYGGSTSRIGG